MSSRSSRRDILRDIETSKKYEIPRAGQSPIFKEDFPISLHGLINADDYIMVVQKLNRIRAKVESKKKYSETLMTGLLLTGTVFLLPLFPLTMLFAKKEKEIATKIEKYLDEVNKQFKEEQEVEFVFVSPYPSSMVKRVYLISHNSPLVGRSRLPGTSAI